MGISPLTFLEFTVKMGDQKQTRCFSSLLEIQVECFRRVTFHQKHKQGKWIPNLTWPLLQASKYLICDIAKGCI